MATSVIPNEPTSLVLTPSDYVSFNTGYTGAIAYVTKYTPSLAKVHIELNKSGMSKGEVTIGKTTTKVKGSTFLAGRCTTSSGTLPATAIVSGNGGAIRVYLSETSSAFAINGFFGI